MPNKYEREIEEILRNLERTEPKPGLGQKLGGRLRRRGDARLKASRPRPSLPALHFTFSEWCLIIACITALSAGGWAFAHEEADLVTGIIALVGAACIALVVIVPFATGSRYRPSNPRYGNVTRIRRNPLSNLVTRWNLFLLKLHYRRRRDR